MDNGLSSTYSRLSNMRTKYLKKWVFSAFKIDANLAMLTLIYKDATNTITRDTNSKEDLSFSFTNDTDYKAISLSFTNAKIILRELQFYSNFMSNEWLEQAVWRLVFIIVTLTVLGMFITLS